MNLSKNSGNHEVTITEAINEINCPVTYALEMIGGKWKAVILYVLSSGTKRFGEIAVRIPTISRKVLTSQLKELERDELVIRERYKEIPPRVEYSLTEKGKSLAPVFKELETWGSAYTCSKLQLNNFVSND